MRIEIFKNKVPREELIQLAKESFNDWVKAVVDIEEGVIAIGGSLHSDAENLLLQRGSQQENLWGINIYLNKDRDNYIVYESFINIHPQQNNTTMLIQDTQLKSKIKTIVDRLVQIHDQ
jgi:hypothetical protein